jgi:hypothetical protein
MIARTLRTSLLLGGLATALAAVPLDAKPSRKARVDLADTAAGVYHGDVISDARGSSQSDVTISVDKTGPNTVRITSDYERLPEFTTRLTRAMQTIQQVGTEQVFLLDLSKHPHTLMVTVDDASWGGERAAAVH